MIDRVYSHLYDKDREHLRQAMSTTLR